MRTIFAKALLAALCGWLLLFGSAEAQLTREWSFNLSTLGPGSYSKKTVIVDDSGNTYAMSMPGAALAGARVTKIKPDGTVEWQVDHLQAGLYPDYFGRSTAGDFYVAGTNGIEGGWTVSATGIKFTSTGSFAWATTVTPVNAPRFGSSHAIASVDSDGNLWLGINESPTDSICIDSFPSQNWPTGESAEMYEAVLYRMESSSGSVAEVDRFDGGVRRPGGLFQVITDNEGFIDVQAWFVDYCCNDFCQGCGDSCFTQPTWPYKQLYRQSFYLRRYSSSGALSGSTWLAASDDEFYSTRLLRNRNGDLLTVIQRYMSPPPYWTYLSRFGHWTVPMAGEFIDESRLITDYSGDIFTIAYDDEITNTSTLRSIDGASGSVRWTKVTNWGTMGVDREGHALLKDYSNNLHKLDEFGNELWTYNPGYNMGDYLYADTNGCLYYLDYQTLYKYRTTKDLVIRDANNDSIPNVEFELIKVRNDPPTFTEDTLGKFSTNERGLLRLELLPDNKFLFVHHLGADTLAAEDTIKIAKHVFSEPARKHEGVLGTMYSVHLDNMQIDGDGSVSFLVLDDMAEQEVLMNHTEYRYNLLVSVEWDAERPYLWGLQDNVKAMSNYLYDVTDGQVRLDTVMIIDDHQEWDLADVQVYASNILGSYTWAHGIYQELIEGSGGLQPASIVIPRRDYGDALPNRDSTYAHHPLSGIAQEAYRVLAHEFGHYAFGFFDEYQFCCAADGSYDKNPLSALKCPDVGYYGYMHWLRDAAGERASELSSAGAYAVPECRNTKQYHELGASCWDYLEAQFEGHLNLDASPSTSILVPIIKPDEPERELPVGLDFLPGPNNNLGNVPGALDYDIGSLIVFNVDVVPPAPQVKSLHVNVHGVPPGGAQVKLNKVFTGGILPIDQGQTTALGLIWVLGATEGVDQIDAGGRRFDITPPPGLAASASVSDGWLFASTSVTASDSVDLNIGPISGDYPLICEPVLGATDLTLSLIFQTPFDELPTLAAYPTGHSSSAPAVTLGAETYDAVVTDSLGSAGQLQVGAVDAIAQSFRLWMDYAHATVDSSDRQILGPRHLSLVEFDSADTGVERAILVASPYPALRSGLDADAVQAGETQSLSVYPSAAMTHTGVITIGYDDAALMLGGGLKADESSLQIYQWNTSLSEWILIGGFVDTLMNEAWSVIPGAGIYAAFTTQIITDVEEDEYDDVLPYQFELSQNYPNPFNPITTIKYSLPERSHVVIEVYNVLGQKVQTLVNREESAGSYTVAWDGTSSSGKTVTTGIYLYRFQAGDHIETRKMILLK